MNVPAATRRPIFFRRKYIVSKSFQWRFIGYIALAALLFVGCVYGATWYFFSHVASQAHLDGLPDNHIFFKMLNAYRADLNITFLIPSLVLVVGMTLYSIFWSNRIAGPLYRLSRHLQEMADGKAPTPLKFREGDFFQDIPTAFNEFLSSATKSDGKWQSGGSERHG